MIYKKMVAACTGAALAVASCVGFYAPVPVHAEGTEELRELIEYILALTGNDAAFIRTPAGAFVTGAEIAIYLATENPMNVGEGNIAASSISFCSGYYTYNGELCTAYASFSTGSQISNMGDKTIPILKSSKFDVDMWCDEDVSTLRGYFEAQTSSAKCYLQSNGLTPPRLSYLRFTSDYWQNISYSYTCPTISDGYAAHYAPCFHAEDFHAEDTESIPELANKTPEWICSQLKTSGASQIFALSPYAGTLPEGTIDLDNPMDYINNVLRPYVLEYYPDGEPFLPADPDATAPPFTLPPEWLEEPSLPAIETYDFETAGYTLPTNPVNSLESVSNGMQFWWAAVTQLLTTSGMLPLAVALLLIGVAVWAIVYLGG